MKKWLLSLCVLFVTIYTLNAQEKQFNLYAVAFYNLENLFNTTHDEGKNDYEYLPEGTNHWTVEKYNSKLKNMSEVLAELATDKLPLGVAFCGVSEVENLGCLQDLVAQPALKPRNWQIVHIEGPDRRGVDCALLYNPRFFKVDSYRLAPYIDEDTSYRTRGFLVIDGQLAEEKVSVIVSHWPSRFATSPAREKAGAQVRNLKDSLLKVDPQRKIFIMGDLNDDPMDKSVSKSLGAKRYAKDCEATDLYNPFWEVLAKGTGSLMYDGKWNLFDQIILSSNLVTTDRSMLSYYRPEASKRPYLFTTEGAYKGYPKRTAAGGVWLNGFSDHLPTIVYLLKEKK